MKAPGFEKDFRDKLRNREIRPTEDSWDRLNNQLDQTRRRGNKRSLLAGVAAVVAIGFLITTFFFSQPETPSVVLEESAVKEIEQNQERPESRLKLEETTTTPASTVAQSPVVHSEQPLEQPVSIESVDKAEPELAQTHLSEMKKTGQPLAPGIQDAQTFTDDHLRQKVDELIVEVQQLEQENGQVSDAEIEALLLLALQDLEDRDDTNSDGVDADELLAEVENELENSFRKRVFQLVKQGFELTRTAVVDRIQN